MDNILPFWAIGPLIFGTIWIIGVIIQIIGFIKSKSNIPSSISRGYRISLIIFGLSGAFIILLLIRPEHPAEQLIFQGITGAVASFIAASIIGIKNIRTKYVYLTLIFMDVIFVLAIIAYSLMTQADLKKRGYNALSKEQAIAIASKDINTGVKSEVTYVNQSDIILSNYGYIWDITFRLYDKRGHIIGGHRVYVDNKEGKIIYDEPRKTECKLLLNQQPIQNGEVMAVDTENREDGTNVYTAKSVDDYGFTNNDGKINISLNTKGNSYITFIDSSGIARIKTITYSQVEQDNCIIDYTNIQPQNLQNILR